jgi:hypothetical protein
MAAMLLFVLSMIIAGVVIRYRVRVIVDQGRISIKTHLAHYHLLPPI